MSLFVEEPINLLPYDGVSLYLGKIWLKEKADYYYHQLLQNIEWRHEQLMMFGKEITSKRKVAWYGDKAFRYTYSNTTKTALPWTKELLEIKTILENESGETFNSCLLNLYHSGDEGMGWHSDDEPEMKYHAAIASISFGAERKFVFKHKVTKDKVEIYLEHGSLLLMKGSTQSFWLHTLPKTKKIDKSRINLTFRTMK